MSMVWIFAFVLAMNMSLTSASGKKCHKIKYGRERKNQSSMFG